MTSISRSFILTFITQFPTQLFGIIAGIFITRILGPTGRGLYAILLADIGLFNIIFSFSITTAIIYFISSKKIPLNKILGISITSSLITVLLIACILFVWLNLPIAELLFPKSINNWAFIIWFILYLIATQITSIYSSLLQGIMNFKAINIISLTNSCFNITLFGLAYLAQLYQLYQITLLDIMILSLIIIIFNWLISHFFYKKYIKIKPSFKFNWLQDIKPFFQYMGLGHLSNIINYFNYRLVLWIIAYYLNEAQVGIYSLAAGLTQILTFISNPLSQVLLPFLSSENNATRITSFIKFARLHFSLIIIIAALGAIFAPFLIPFLYGLDFSDAVIPFEIMIFATVLSCQTKIFAGFLLADNKVIINLLATITGFILTLVFNFILIKKYAIIGASFATSITFIGIFGFVYFVLIKYSNISTKNLFTITKAEMAILKKLKFK